MKHKNVVTSLTGAILFLIVAAGAALSAQDRFSVKVPGGLAFSEFKGYETWQTISISHNGDKLAVINSGGLDIRFLSSRTPSLQAESSFGRTFPRFYIRGLGNTDFDPHAAQARARQVLLMYVADAGRLSQGPRAHRAFAGRCAAASKRTERRYRSRGRISSIHQKRKK